MVNPFIRIARLMFDELIAIASHMRGVPISPQERAEILAQFDRIIPLIARVLTQIPLEEILQFFPADRRHYVRITLSVAEAIINAVDRLRGGE